jgi:hypothetical protein
MSHHYFMLWDWAAIAVAFCIFPLVALAPGYALGWMLDLMQFRKRTPWARVAMSVPLSIAVGPILGYFIGRLVPMTAVVCVYGVFGLTAIWLFTKTRLDFRLSGTELAAFGVALIWIVLATLMLADLEWRGRSYFPIIALDYAVRTAFTNSISLTGIPAQTPFFFPGHEVALRYHYFWLIPCAVVQMIGQPLIGARHALIAGTLWCGIGFMCLIALYLRLFNPRGASGLAKRTLITVALLGVTGLDIVPAVLMLWLHHIGLMDGISPSVEWWNNQVDGWLYTMLWEPHYMASLIACLTGFLVLWEAAPAPWGWRKIAAGIAAGFAFAGAVGAGIYVAFVFAIFLAIWTFIALIRKWHAEAGLLALSGAVALVASIPFLRSLQTPAAGGQFLHFSIRSFNLAEILLTLLHLEKPWQAVLANLIFLPLNYFLELGFFLGAGLLLWTRFRREKRSATRPELAAFTMTITSVVVCTFLRSGVIENNDLGWRGFLIAQFVLLIGAADLLAGHSISGSDRKFLAVLMVVGIAGVAYDLAILRLYPVLSDAGKVPRIAWVASDDRQGYRNYAAREAYEWIRTRTPRDAIVQQNPNPVLQETLAELYSDRRTVAADSACSTVFGGDPEECPPVVRRLTGLFSSGPDASSRSFDAACANLPIDIVAAKDTDRAWQDRSSWVWTRAPVFANDFVRVFTCEGKH